MTKRDKIRLLLQTASLNRRQEERFKKLFSTLPIAQFPQLIEIKDKFSKKVEKFIAESLEQQVDLYDKSLSEEAIDASLLFYSSKEGQEVISKLPEINEGLTVLTLEFTSQVMFELFEDLKASGITEEELSEGLAQELEEEEKTDDKINVEDPEVADIERFFKEYGVDWKNE